MNDIAKRLQIHAVTILSMRKYFLRGFDLSWLRTDGTWQRQQREVFDKGDGAVVLLFNRAKRTVVLVGQFRLPAFLAGHRAKLIEAPAGVLDGADPRARIIAEIEEETGYRVAEVERVFEAFMSPGAVTERLYFFAAEYSERVGAGGGLEEQGEDLEVLELSFDEAYAMIGDGQIVDAKTIMLLQYAKLTVFDGGPPCAVR